MKASEMPTKISFKDTPTVTIEYNLATDLVERQGERGAYYMLPVKLHPSGAPALLPFSSNRLVKKLQSLPNGGIGVAKITRIGSGMETDFQVEQIGQLKK